jgi:hemoglobin-like flavoprotein
VYFNKAQRCPFLTNHELSLVQDSWKEVEKLGLENVGRILFKNIFTAAPSALLFFSFKDEVNLYESKAFNRHAKSVVTTVGVAVNSLENVKDLVPVLVQLGVKHSTMGSPGNRIVQAHYDLVGQQLIVSS